MTNCPPNANYGGPLNLAVRQHKRVGRAVNLILGPAANVPYLTDMRKTLADAGIDAAAYDWYVSDLETNRYVRKLRGDPFWISGPDLKEIIETPRLQFIWAVLSAFPKGPRPEILCPPIAKGNSRYWEPPDPVPQLPGACFEVVCWDSSYTLLIGLSQEQAVRYCASHPEAKPLSSVWDASAT